MKKGLTLAETLVTLGILGVIATITMPTINTSSWKGQREALLKSAYARVKNAMDMAIQDLGYTPKCAKNDQVESECKALGDAIINNLHIVNICNGTTNCKPKYIGIDDNFKSIQKGLLEGKNEQYINAMTTLASFGYNGFKTEALKSNYAFHTANNFTIINHSADDSFIPDQFAIDTNGNKGPNKWGHDLFPFQIQYARNGKNLELKPVSNQFLKETHSGLTGINAIDILQNR